MTPQYQPMRYKSHTVMLQCKKSSKEKKQEPYNYIQKSALKNWIKIQMKDLRKL